MRPALRLPSLTILVCFLSVFVSLVFPTFTQSCSAEDLSKQGDWDTSCDGTYPGACGAAGDLLSCDDGFVETHSFRNTANAVGGVRAETHNSSVIDCGSITSVMLCYEWWSGGAGTTCDISVDNDGDDSWAAVTTACPGTSADPGVACANVTSLEDWSCTDFFKPLYPNATIKSEIYRISGGTVTASWDVLFFNVTYALDTTSPDITIQSPTNTSYATDTPDLNYTVTDMNLDSCWLYLDGVYNSSLPGCTNTTIGPLADGPHNVTVYANDTMNNTNSSTVYFSTDATPPSLTIQSPQNTSYNTSSVDLNYTASDNIALDSCWYSLDGGAAVPLASCDNDTISGLSDGPHNVTVYANDTVNNTDSSTVHFSTDANAPSIIIQSPTNTSYATNMVDLNYTATDMNLDSCWLYLDGVYNSSLPGCTNTTIGPLADGPHNVTVYANDTMNNTDSSTVSFTVALPKQKDDDGGEDRELSVGLTTSCDWNTVTVEYKGEPLSGVDVLVIDDASLHEVFSGSTDSDGQVEFAGCGITVRVTASKSGYGPESLKRSLVDCGLCLEPECASDDDCQDTYLCVDGECVPVECECGYMEDHHCIEYECCADTDCPEGNVCVDNECQEAHPEVECETDEGCAGDERCVEDSCEPITGACGYAEGHVWVEYACGDEPECLPCPEGTACVDNRCVKNSIAGPDSSSVGGNATLTATEDGGACANCLVEITDPTGEKTVIRTDGEGKFVLMFEIDGEYRMAVIRNGEPVATKNVNVWAEPPEPEEAVWWPWLLLVPVLPLLLFYLWEKRRKS